MRKFVAISTSVISLCWGASASAQAIQPTNGPDAAAAGTPSTKAEKIDGPAPPGASDSGVAEIVVTAQRRSEALSRAAIAASVVSGDSLAIRNITTVVNLTKLVPALQIAQTAGPYNVFSIRGVANFNGNGLSDSAVAFNFDGVYIARPTSTSGFFYDLQRVEVLKGPQGILYGRNATAGAINVIPTPPSNETGGYLSASYGNYQAKQVEGALNVRVSDKVAVRGSLQIVDRNGYFSDGSGDDKSQAARLQILAKPNSDLSFKVLADYSHQGGLGGGATVIGKFNPNDYVGMGDPRTAAIYTHSFYVAPPTGKFAPVLIPLNTLPTNIYNDNNFYGVQGEFNWTSKLGTLTVQPGYREGDLNFRTTVPGYIISLREKDQQESIEARFASRDTLPLRWIIGTYLLNETIDSHPVYNQGLGLQILTQNVHAKTTSYSAFGQLIFAVRPDLRITGGVRYTYDDKSAVGDSSSLRYLTVAPNTTAPVTSGFALNARKNFDRVTWKAGLEWDVRPTSLLYANVSTGFKAGGFYFSPVSPTYAPETITAYTLGSKNRFLGGRLVANVEGFYWKYRNQQVSFIGYIAPGVVGLPTFNIGDSTIKGIETDLQFRPWRNTLLGSQIQYSDAKYNSFLYIAPNLGQPPRTGCAYSLQTAGYQVDCSGKTAPEAPKWTLVESIEQTFDLGSDYRLVFGARTRFESQRFLSFSYLPNNVAPSNTLTDLDLTLVAPRGQWSVGAFVNNVENKGVYGFSTPTPLTLVPAALDYATLRPPRTFGAKLRYHF